MQKTFLRFAVFELVERLIRLRVLVNEIAPQLQGNAPGIYQALLQEVNRIGDAFFAQKNSLNKLFPEESELQAKAKFIGPGSSLDDVYQSVCQASELLLRLNRFDLEPETLLFLKDVLPPDLLNEAGEQSVFLATENKMDSGFATVLPGILADSLSILQKNNPLGWMGLTRAYAASLIRKSPLVAKLKSGMKNRDEAQVDVLVQHAANLRLLGPAYYFQTVGQAVLAGDDAFFQNHESALFFGLNHQNFMHKSLVILHEAAEKFKQGLNEQSGARSFSEEEIASVFRTVEKMVPDKIAFQEKNMERAVQLQSRIAEGVLLSSTPVYPVEEVNEALNANRDSDEFSIYETLSMMTEYPHTPREIINAGWLHRMERGSIWLYSILNEDRAEGYDKVTELLDYQDHLLRKSIEVSEVHRVLLCTP